MPSMKEPAPARQRRRIQVRRSGVHGRGVFAEVAIAQGEIILEYAGEVIDWDEWRPTELSFYLMKLGCKLESKNPYTAAPQGQANGFLRHMGSTSFFEALKRDGAKVDVDLYIRTWQAQAQAYQQKVRQYWLY